MSKKTGMLLSAFVAISELAQGTYNKLPNCYSSGGDIKAKEAHRGKKKRRAKAVKK